MVGKKGKEIMCENLSFQVINPIWNTRRDLESMCLDNFTPELQCSSGKLYWNILVWNNIGLYNILFIKCRTTLQIKKKNSRKPMQLEINVISKCLGCSPTVLEVVGSNLSSAVNVLIVVPLLPPHYIYQI